MIFTETSLGGAFVVDLERREDPRGFFARVYCRREFEAHGLDPTLMQGNLSFNLRKGTVRGMHFQFPPAAETKLVRCTRGSILDVIVDLRPESPTFLQHVSVELTADNRRALYVPRRFAHGYQVLESETEVTYLTGADYAPELEGGLVHDDPRLGIDWPLPTTELSDKDRAWPSLLEGEATLRARMAVATTGGGIAARERFTRMIIVDTALKAREAKGQPIRLGMVGAGFMGRGVANQVVNHVTGMRLSAVYARRVEQAVSAYTYSTSGCEPVVASDQQTLDRAIETGTPVVTNNPLLLCRSPHLDALMDVTGAVELGAQVALEAFAHRKHLVLMNAELDATLGSILAVYAARSGVVLSTCDGDQPAVQINLHRFVTGLGLVPRVMGNIKGLQDRYRTPLTQRAFAEKWGQKPEMVTSFADGSKVNFEQAIVANATGLTVAKRGLLGYDHPAHIDTLTTRYDLDMLRAHGGIVEYVVGAQPGPGIFCLAEETDPRQRHYLNLYKLGEGPLYSFYTPYHLCHFEAPTSVARAVLFGDSAGTPLRGPLVEVCAVAKRDLQAGETLDGYGHFMTYGEAVSAAERRSGRYLPEGLVEGCRLRRSIAKDQVLTYDDVDVPPGRLVDRLYAEQQSRFDPEARTEPGAGGEW